MVDETTLARLTNEVARILLQRGYRLSTAESCTGGWIAKCCTDIAGSSDWFERGYVTYSNQAKIDLLSVQATTLSEQGAVSEPVVREMVNAALQRGKVDIAVAVSGIAGPGGGSGEKPVGTVYLGWAIPGKTVVCREQFAGDRHAIRLLTVAAAMQGIIDLLAA